MTASATATTASAADAGSDSTVAANPGSGRATAITAAATIPATGPPAIRPQTYAATTAASVTTASPVRTPVSELPKGYETATRSTYQPGGWSRNTSFPSAWPWRSASRLPR